MTTSKRLRACAKHTGLDAVAELLTEAADTIDRREAVIKILEDDAAEAHQKISGIKGRMKVLWTLLGECLPLLHQLDCNDPESEQRLNGLIQCIEDARTLVQIEEMGRVAA